MCEPVTVSLIAASTVAKVYGDYQEAQAQKAQLEAQAKLEEQRAGDARLRGQIEAGLQRMQTSSDIAEQTLDYAAAGVDPTSGTTVSVAASTRALGEFEALTRENDAIREAWGLETSAKMSRYQKKLVDKKFKANAIGNIIGGGAEAYYKGSALKTPSSSKLATTKG